MVSTGESDTSVTAAGWNNVSVSRGHFGQTEAVRKSFIYVSNENAVTLGATKNECPLVLTTWRGRLSLAISRLYCSRRICKHSLSFLLVHLLYAESRCNANTDLQGPFLNILFSAFGSTNDFFFSVTDPKTSTETLLNLEMTRTPVLHRAMSTVGRISYAANVDRNFISYLHIEQR